ncbi:hypothetical protein ACFP81_12335 [Deinococcus lacus]|uniref:DUF11 domain-containing protein n=1 Tax=Deinococcus lacus TaxID=392561 RepID=A0ABW1YGY9_9DEIO
MDNLNYNLTVTAANTPTPLDPTFKTVIDENQPAIMTSTNITTPGSRVLSVACTKDSALPAALRPEFTDRANVNAQVVNTSDNRFSFTVTGLDVGVIANCLISNDSSQTYPVVDLTKQVPERAAAGDQFRVDATTPVGGAATASTTGTATSATTRLVVRPTYTTQPIAGGQQLVEDALPSVTVGEAALGTANLAAYRSTTTCTSTGGTAPTGLPNNASVTTATFTPNYNNVVACTITNVAVPTTTVNVTKTGQTVVTAGQAVTYTITAENTSGRAANVTLTDTLNPVRPASEVTVSDGGTYDPATGVVTWNLGSLASGASLQRTVTLDLPDPVAATLTSGPVYTGPTAVSNTAAVQTDVNNTSTATSASVTTNVAYASATKTVQNLSESGPVGTVAEGGPGQTLRYCLNYRNYSAVALPQVRLTDPLQAGQTLTPDSVTVTRSTGSTALSDNSVSTLLDVALPDVQPGETGSVCFDAEIPGGN